jgi:DNA-binding Xre family transcriptional regulator
MASMLLLSRKKKLKNSNFLIYKLLNSKSGKNKVVKIMIIDVMKLKIAMARACMGVADLGEKANVGRATLIRILRDDGENVRCKTVGKLARALGVDVLDLIAKDEK